MAHQIWRVVVGTAIAIGLVAFGAQASIASQTSPGCQTSIAGRLDLVPSESRVFHNQRYLRVWLPSGYSDPSNAEKRYPVLYMMDGQTLFGDCAVGAPPEEWGIDERLTRLIANNTIPPVIVVGIDSMFRERELIPYRDPFFLPDSGEPIGRQFPDFLARDVIPLITKRYRVAAGPQAIGGFSYGAVAALWTLLARPDLFTLGLLDSPSLGVGNGQLLRDTAYLFKGPAKVFLGAGDSEFLTEGGNRGYLQALELLEQNLKGALQGPTEVMNMIVPGGKHSIAASAQRFERAISFLLGQPRP